MPVMRIFGLFWLVFHPCIAGAIEYVSSSPVRDVDVIAIKSILVTRHPELAASPGVRYSRYLPGRGEPGCEDGLDEGSKDAQWIAVSGAFDEADLEELMAATFPCALSVADIYFEPFRESAGRSDGAFVRCRAPAGDPSEAEVALQWACEEVIFRQYVQLDDQECEVTLIGDVSDAELREVKKLGLAADEPEPLEKRNTLMKFQIMPNKAAFAVFGSQECRAGESTFYYRRVSEPDSHAEQRWVLLGEPPF